MRHVGMQCDLLCPAPSASSIPLCVAFNQSNKVKGSYHMEKEGLHRCLSFLKEHDLDVAVLVTDRHKQINKWFVGQTLRCKVLL